MLSLTSAPMRTASAASASRSRGASGRSTWSAMRANGDAAALHAFTQSWWKYSAAPWSSRCSLQCHTSRLVLRAVRSTLATKASNISEEHMSELQSLTRISDAVLGLQKTKQCREEQKSTRQTSNHYTSYK